MKGLRKYEEESERTDLSGTPSNKNMYEGMINGPVKELLFSDAD